MRTALPQQFVISPYSNTLPSSTLTTDAPSQQMTCPKMTPSTNPVPMPVIQPNRQVPDRHSNTNLPNHEVPDRHSNTNQLNHEVPDRHTIQICQTMKYLTLLQTLDTIQPNHEVPDKHSIQICQTMKYLTLLQALNTIQPNHEVPDRHSVQNYKSYHPKITGNLARGLVSPDQFRLPYNTT